MKNSPTIPSTLLPQTSTKLPYFANSLENITNGSKDPPLSSDHHQDHLVPILVFLIFFVVVAILATIVGFKTRCCHRGSDSGSYRLESRRIEVGASNRQVGGTDFDDASLGGKSPRTSKRLQKRKNKKHKTTAKKLVDREWYVWDQPSDRKRASLTISNLNFRMDNQNTITRISHATNKFRSKTREGFVALIAH